MVNASLRNCHVKSWPFLCNAAMALCCMPYRAKLRILLAHATAVHAAQRPVMERVKLSRARNFAALQAVESLPTLHEGTVT